VTFRFSLAFWFSCGTAAFLVRWFRRPQGFRFRWGQMLVELVVASTLGPLALVGIISNEADL
jgi:hypothetical protein